MPVLSRAAFAYGEKRFADWLYGEYDEEKLTKFELLHSIAPVGAYMDYLLDVRADREYMQRHQLTYSDIHDPRKLKQTSSGSRLYGSALNYMSKNVTRLYKD